jgi:hypothetical protein
MSDQLRGRITNMPSLKAHFDGRSIVLDEPATLAVGQAVRVIVEPRPVMSQVESPADDLTELARRTDDALKSTREAFASGMTDDELAEFLEVETHAMRGIAYDRE